MSAPDEPAIKSYFFGKGYTDLRDTIAESWKRNLASAQGHLSKAAPLSTKDVPERGLALVLFTAAISVVLFGTAVFLLAAAIHIVVLLLFFLVIYLAFSVILLTEKTVLQIRKYFTVCPECHRKYPLPEYFCPSCNAVHRRLIPSSYGILRRTCECGEKLASTFFLNRNQLTARCPHCEHVLEADHVESRKLFVPLVGGTAVGKTVFLGSAVKELIEQAFPERSLTCDFVDSHTERELERLLGLMAHGTAPDKTTATLPRALNLRLGRKGQSPRVLYLYDPAGEAFMGDDELVLHRYQEYFSGMVFLIDPFSIEEVMQHYEEPLREVAAGVQPSPLPVREALQRVLLSMQENFGLGLRDRVKQPLAVVLNKIDVFDLEERLGPTAVEAKVASGQAETAQEGQNQLIREWLIEYGQHEIVQKLEARFASLRYFACTSLGRTPDGSVRPFEPRGSLEPFLWILEKSDRFFLQPDKAA